MSKPHKRAQAEAGVTSEARPTRKDTLILAKTTAVILELAGVTPKDFTNFFSTATYEERTKRFTRKVVTVQTGVESASKTVMQGWELTNQLTHNGDHHSNHDLLVLEAGGTLAVLDYTSSFVFSSGYSRERTVGLTDEYPRLGTTDDMRGYEDPIQKEALVQQRLAGLVVPHGLHEGTIFEQAFHDLAARVDTSL